MNVDSLIFDLDGTLWNSSEGILAAWKAVLKNHPEVDTEITQEMLSSTFGKQVQDICRAYFPDMPFEKALGLMDECSEVENGILYEMDGLTFPGVMETLELLAKKIPLFIVSNCQVGYIESFLHGHHVEHLFKDFESAGATGLTKGENIRLVMERNGLKTPMYVGDTQSDADAAQAAGIPVIYASYGFGQISAYEAKLDHFEEILHIVNI